MQRLVALAAPAECVPDAALMPESSTLNPDIALTPCFLGCSKADQRAKTDPSSLLAA